METEEQNWRVRIKSKRLGFYLSHCLELSAFSTTKCM